MLSPRFLFLSLLFAVICVFPAEKAQAAESTEDMSVAEEDSVAEEGEFSESNIERGKNRDISDDTVENLPPSLREVWANRHKTEQRERREHRDRRKTLTSTLLVDEIIPAYGVQYITEQRNFSRVEPLWLEVRRFLTDVNIKVMSGQLGRQGPTVVKSERNEEGEHLQGNVALEERVPLPEEVKIKEYHQKVVDLRKRISYPNLLERDHFNEIVGDLAKAQGLINYDLTEEGIKRIDEQFAAWRILIEVARLKAIEKYTRQLLEENPEWDMRKARREAERAEIEFIYPPLPGGEHALQEARAELHRMHEVRSPENTKNVRARKRETGKEAEEAPEIIDVEEPEEEDGAEDGVMEEEAAVVEETDDAAMEESEEQPIEEKEELDDLNIDVEDFNIDGDGDEKAEEPEEATKEESTEEQQAGESTDADEGTDDADDDGGDFEFDFE